jgi:hypothetical protein
MTGEPAKNFLLGMPTLIQEISAVGAVDTTGGNGGGGVTGVGIGIGCGLGAGRVGFQPSILILFVSSRSETQAQVQDARPALFVTHCGVRSLHPRGGIGLMGVIAHCPNADDTEYSAKAKAIPGSFKAMLLVSHATQESVCTSRCWKYGNRKWSGNGHLLDSRTTDSETSRRQRHDAAGFSGFGWDRTQPPCTAGTRRARGWTEDAGEDRRCFRNPYPRLAGISN